MKSEIYLIACFSSLVIPSFVLSIYAITQLPSADNAPLTAVNLSGNWECSGTYARINEVGIISNYSHPETLATGSINPAFIIIHEPGEEVFIETKVNDKQGSLCKAKNAKDYICYEYYSTTSTLSQITFLTLNNDGSYNAFALVTGDTYAGYGSPRMYSRHCSRAS